MNGSPIRKVKTTTISRFAERNTTIQKFQGPYKKMENVELDMDGRFFDLIIILKFLKLMNVSRTENKFRSYFLSGAY